MARRAALLGAAGRYASGGASAADGTQAAVLLGWGSPVAGDEFNYTGVPDSARWNVYDGPGHAGNGVRSPARATVANGKMTLTGLAGSANTAGMEFKRESRFCRVEIRCCSFYTSSPSSTGLDGGYHPVLIWWTDAVSWPTGGEFDLLENGEPGDQSAQATMHYPSLDGDDHFVEVTPLAVDLRQMRNIAFEWSSTGVKGWVDGQPWYSLSGGATSTRKAIQDMPTGHLTVQLDAFQSTGCLASTFQLEWVRIYANP